MKTVIKAQIVAHSINEQGDELISVLATFPRIILAEVNTHRMLSKNTSSSRAIPFNKMVDTIQKDPFIPIAWQKEHKGMQGNDYFQSETGENVHKLVEGWLDARNSAVQIATGLNNSNVTKQLCNRLLEPFMWTTMLITGPKSSWDNFFHLRCPSYTFHIDESEKDFVFKSKKDVINLFGEDEEVEYESGNIKLKDLSNIQWLQLNYGKAEIHMMALAECVWDAYNESTPKQLEAGEWHIPFEDRIDENKLDRDLSWLDLQDLAENADLEYSIWLNHNKIKISTAMAARTSYTVVGEEKEVDYQKMIELHDRLLAQDPPHSSPFEHTCQVVSQEEYNNSFKGKEAGWFRNYRGFKSYRQIVEESR